MTGFYIALAVLGILGFAAGLTWYAIRRIDAGAPGWVAKADEKPLGTGACPKGHEGTKGKPGEKSAA